MPERGAPPRVDLPPDAVRTSGQLAGGAAVVRGRGKSYRPARGHGPREAGKPGPGALVRHGPMTRQDRAPFNLSRAGDRDFRRNPGPR